MGAIVHTWSETGENGWGRAKLDIIRQLQCHACWIVRGCFLVLYLVEWPRELNGLIDRLIGSG